MRGQSNPVGRKMLSKRDPSGDAYRHDAVSVPKTYPGRRSFLLSGWLTRILHLRVEYRESMPTWWEVPSTTRNIESKTGRSFISLIATQPLDYRTAACLLLFNCAHSERNVL